MEEGAIEPLLAELLAELLAGIREALAERLVGLYLFGSATSSDFEPGISDLDLLAATEGDVSDDDVARLGGMHQRFAERHPAWDDRVEVIYLSTEALGSFKSRRSPIAVISPGEPLHVREEGAGSDWLMNWHLVTHGGRTLFGPEPTTFIAPTSHQEFVQSLREHVLEGETWMLRALNPKAQSYVILTLCRTLVAVNAGAHASKREAAAWVERNRPEWASLAEKAIAWRTDERADERQTPISLTELAAFFDAVRLEVLTFAPVQ